MKCRIQRTQCFLRAFARAPSTICLLYMNTEWVKMYIWNRTCPCPCIKYLASRFEVDILVVYLTILQHNNIHVVELDVEPNLFNLIFDLIKAWASSPFLLCLISIEGISGASHGSRLRRHCILGVLFKSQCPLVRFKVY